MSFSKMHTPRSTLALSARAFRMLYLSAKSLGRLLLGMYKTLLKVKALEEFDD